MKTHFSIAELLNLNVSALPSSKSGLIKRIQSECWPFVEVAGKGGRNGKRREYAPPPDVMKQIQARKLEEALDGLEDLPSPTEMEGKPAVMNEETPLALPETACIVDGSTEQQRLCESSRRGVLAAVERVMAEAGVSKEAAITTVLTQAKMPGFEHIEKLFSLAADGRGGGGKLPSTRTIKRWFAARECNSLAPKISQKDMNVPSWLPLFLECYRLPMKPSVAEAYRFFLRRLESDGNECPSIHTVRRWLDKVGNVERERGRRGARDLKNILPHKRRDFLHLKPAAIYTADGHTFDAEVLNPLSGMPFRPEITTVLDVGTRRCMGWSVGLAESRFTVLEALSHASRAAIGAIWYVDWGKGFENLMMTDEATGLMGRLGMPPRAEGRRRDVLLYRLAHRAVFTAAVRPPYRREKSAGLGQVRQAVAELQPRPRTDFVRRQPPAAHLQIQHHQIAFVLQRRTVPRAKGTPDTKTRRPAGRVD